VIDCVDHGPRFANCFGHWTDLEMLLLQAGTRTNVPEPQSPSSAPGVPALTPVVPTASPLSFVRVPRPSSSDVGITLGAVEQCRVCDRLWVV